MQPGPDGGNRVGGVQTIDYEGHGDPQIGIRSQFITLDGNLVITGQMSWVHHCVPRQPRELVLVEDFTMSQAKSVSFLKKSLDKGLLFKRKEYFSLHGVHKVRVSKKVTRLCLNDKNVFFRRSSLKNVSFQVFLDNFITSVVGSQRRPNKLCTHDVSLTSLLQQQNVET